jgi:hypothetical protein
MIEMDDGRRLEIGCLREDKVMVSFLCSLEIPQDELSSMPIARE